MSHTTVTYKGSTQMRIDMRWLSEALNQSSTTEQVLSTLYFIGKESTLLLVIYLIFQVETLRILSFWKTVTTKWTILATSSKPNIKLK